MKLESKNSAPDGGEWTIKAAGLTHQGQVREDNEDAFLLSTEQGLYLVSDGMGGTTAGKAISNAVVEVLPVQLNELIQEATIYESTQMASILGKAIAMLSDELLERSSKDRSLCGAGAAVVSCWLLNGIAVMAHMGDCRLYRLRSSHFEKLTDDHNIAALLLQMGHIDEKEALKHPGRHMLTRFVGMEPEAQPDMSALEVVPGDKLLLCSDGLWGVVKDESLYSMLSSDSDLETICEQMIFAANAAGGPDNITALVIEVGPLFKKSSTTKLKAAHDQQEVIKAR